MKLTRTEKIGACLNTIELATVELREMGTSVTRNHDRQVELAKEIQNAGAQLVKQSKKFRKERMKANA